MGKGSYYKWVYSLVKSPPDYQLFDNQEAFTCIDYELFPNSLEFKIIILTFIGD